MHFTSILEKFNINNSNNSHQRAMIAVDRDHFKILIFINNSVDMIIYAGNLQIRTVKDLNSI